METLDALTSVLLGSKTFDLKVMSWQLFLQGVSRNDYRKGAEDTRVKLQCRLQQSLWDGDALVEGGTVENLNSLKFTIEVRNAEKVFSDFEKANPNSDVGKSAVGLLTYHPPISPEGLAGLPTRIIEESAAGSVSGWTFFGNDSVSAMLRLLTLQPQSEIHLWITVNATAGATPSCLVYEKKEYHPTNYRWYANNNPLEIKEARFVIANHTHEEW